MVSTAIITREARDAAGEVHDRMPAFVTRDIYDEWLSPAKLVDDSEKQHLLDVLIASSDAVARTLTAVDVDRRVNNSRAIDPTDRGLIAPLG